VRIVAEYQFTLEEYKEGVQYLRKALTKRSRRWNRYWIGWFVLCIVAIVFFLFVNLKPSARPQPIIPPQGGVGSDGPLDMVLPILPWLAVFAFVWFFVFYRMRGTIRRNWDNEPALHRVRTVEIDDMGVTFQDQVSQNRRVWAGFVKYVESPNLFLLFPTNYTADLIPKRALGGEKEIQEVREVLAANVHEPVSGFPVVPVGKDEFAG